MMKRAAYKPTTTGLGAALRAAREAANMNQNQLADKAGVSNAVISCVETGATKRPERPTIEKLEKALGVELGKKLPKRGWRVKRASNYTPKALGGGKVVEIGGKKLATVLVTIETEGVFPMRRDTARVFNTTPEQILVMLHKFFGTPEYAAAERNDRVGERADAPQTV